MNNNVFRLTIVNVAYIIRFNHTCICVIRFINPITHNIQHVKGVAKCNPDDKNDPKFGCKIAKSRAKRIMYKWYLNYISKIMIEVVNKYHNLELHEKKYINKSFNDKYYMY